MNNSQPDLINKISRIDLPIVSIIDELLQAFKNNKNIILQASPGAGKTTLVPLVLLQQIEPHHKILLLQPRRIAARSAAFRLAEILNEKVGDTVGYRIRNETKVSDSSKIEVITEGILIRMLQSDPELTDVGLIIFDEFHERNLDSDLGLAFSLEVQQSIRDDLKLLIMSATLELKNLSELLGRAPLIYSEGRSFPVNVEYFSNKSSVNQRLSNWKNLLVSAVKEAIAKSVFEAKNILVFLPGVAEIKYASSLLEPLIKEYKEYQIVEFYGELPFTQQQQIITPQHSNPRIILSTNIAETSVTIEGIGTVIDSGLMRENYFDPNVGFNRLRTVRISQASATQRTGRAGRLAAGRCIRLWNESETLREYSLPDILREDLTHVALEFAAWGIQDVSQLNLLDLPSQGTLQQARQLLIELSALDQQFKLTAYGQRLHSLSVHPRLANMLLRSIDLGCETLACLLTAMLEDKDIFVGEARRNTDFAARINFLVEQILSNKLSRACRQILTRAKKVFTLLLVSIAANPKINKFNKNTFRIDLSIQSELEFASLLLAITFPDRIAKQRGNGYLLSNGSGAKVESPLASRSELIVAVTLGGQGNTSKIFQAIDFPLAELETHFEKQIVETQSTEWDQKTQSVKAFNQRCFGALVLAKKNIPKPDKQLVRLGLLSGLKLHGLPWTDHLRQLQARVTRIRALADSSDDFPDLSEQYLMQNLQQWLAPYLNDLNKLSQVTPNLLSTAVTGLLDWNAKKRLDDLMPERIRVPSGSSIRVDYLSSSNPILAVKLQEMFGAAETPKIASGRIKLLVHLLSPAGRPIAITEDLTSFWKNGYLEVKKQMKGRYPKHPWPDDPLTAIATSRTKNRI